MITVCIPFYQGIFYIKNLFHSLERIKNNSLFKILIIDNNSKDNSYKELKKYMILNKFNNMEIIKNKKNLNFGGNFKKCIRETTTKYLTFLGHDDQIDKGIFAALKFCKKKKINFLDTKLHVKNLNKKNNNRLRIFSFYNKTKKILINKNIFYWWMNSSASALPGWICDSKKAKEYIKFIPIKSVIPSVHLAYYFASDIDSNIWFYNNNICIQHLGTDLSQGANNAYTNLKVHNEWKKLINKIKNEDQKIIAKCEYSNGLIKNLSSYKVFSAKHFFFIIKEIYKFNTRTILNFKNIFLIICVIIIPRSIIRGLYFIYRKRSVG
jgi:hypothetical protein